MMDLKEIAEVYKTCLLTKQSFLSKIYGRLHVTATHLIFFADESKKTIWISIHLIHSIKCKLSDTKDAVFSLKLKDLHKYEFLVGTSHICEKLKRIVTEIMSKFDGIPSLPCFSASFEYIRQSAGWQNPSERLTLSFRRMGLPNYQWRFTDVNKDYELASSYPSVIVVPQGVSKATIRNCAKFRSRGRFPALTYYHSSKGSALCRCSQPLAGLANKCRDDITMLKRIKDVAFEEHTNILHVVDARSKLNAISNRAIGKGYESKTDYENISYKCFQIENIHIMRNSLKGFLKKYKNNGKDKFSFFDKSDWTHHTKLILDASLNIVMRLEQGENVVVHCSDGWDRTSQICALAQIIIDPYFRTVEGLEEIIEKDWISFGHNFKKRCNHLSTIQETDVSPVFLQFLDCIYQLFHMYPDQFQFNELLLRHLHQWTQNCIFGNFIGSCERERIALRVEEQTFSVWGHIKHYQSDYLNPNYNPQNIIPIINKPFTFSRLTLWRSVYYPMEAIFRLIQEHPVDLIQFPIDDNDNCSKTFILSKPKIRRKSMFTSLTKFTDIKKCFKNGKERSHQTILQDGDKMESVMLMFDGNKLKNYGSDNTDETISGYVITDLNMVTNYRNSPMKIRDICFHCGQYIAKASLRYKCRGCIQYFCISCIQPNFNIPGYFRFRYSYPVCVVCSPITSRFRRSTFDSAVVNSEKPEIPEESKGFSNDPLMDYIRQKNS